VGPVAHDESEYTEKRDRDHGQHDGQRVHFALDERADSEETDRCEAQPGDDDYSPNEIGNESSHFNSAIGWDGGRPRAAGHQKGHSDGWSLVARSGIEQYERVDQFDRCFFHVDHNPVDLGRDVVVEELQDDGRDKTEDRGQESNLDTTGNE